MAEFRVTYTLVDAQGGETQRSYSGTFVDYTAAAAAAGTLVTALQNASNAGFVKQELTEIADIATSPGAGTVFEQAFYSVALSGGAGKNGQFNIPMPVASLFITGTNTADISAAAWTAVEGQFASTWTISDGEFITSTNGGKRRYVKSGKTNL